jgi:tetratricopeptide (TPR) repeat protein
LVIGLSFPVRVDMKIILTHIQGSHAGSITEYEGPVVRVGRDPNDCDLIFDSAKEPGVSRVHAEISFSDGIFYLEDLNSRNGTFLETIPIKGKVELSQGSLIQFGAEGPLVRFEVDRAELGVPQTQPLPPAESQAKVVIEEKLPFACRYCGAKFAVYAKFCRRCGKLLPTEVSGPAGELIKENEATPAARVSRPITEVKGSANISEAQKCKSCGEKIEGDPRFCSSCGSVVNPDSLRLHSDDLKDIIKPPAATVYVDPSKIQQIQSPAPTTIKPERGSRLKRNLKSLTGESRQSRGVRHVPESQTPTPQKSPPQAESNFTPELQPPSKQSGSQVKNKLDLPRLQKPGPLIPASRKESEIDLRPGKQGSPSFLGKQNEISDLPKTAIPNSSSPAHSLLISAQALSRKGHLIQAIEECERAIRLDTQLPEAYNLLGQLLLSHGENTKAIAAFEKALKLRPTMAEAYSNLGQAYLRTGRFEDAAVSAREAIKLDQVIPEAYNTIGQALIEIGDYDRAFEAFSRALRVRPNYPESYVGMATVQFRCGHAEESINFCQQAIKARSGYPQAYCLMGQAYRAKGQFDQAGNAFLEAIRLKPDYANAYNYLALNYRSQSITDKAVEACSRAIEIDQNLPEVHNTMGLLYSDQSLFTEALTEYEKAIELRPRYAEAHNNIGLCYFKVRQLDKAIEYFEKAIELEPQFVLARFNLALCFFKKRDKYGVKKQYEVLREIDEARAAKLYQKIKTLI